MTGDDDESLAPGAMVIHLFGPPPAVEGAPSVEYGGRSCYPHTPLVEQHTRKVRCKRCDAELDPIAVLLEVARRHDDWIRLHAEVRTMRAQLEALHADERLTRARTRSHARKDAAEAVRVERDKLARQHAEIATRTDDVRRALDRIDQLVGHRRPERNRRRS